MEANSAEQQTAIEQVKLLRRGFSKKFKTMFDMGEIETNQFRIFRKIQKYFREIESCVETLTKEGLNFTPVKGVFTAPVNEGAVVAPESNKAETVNVGVQTVELVEDPEEAPIIEIRETESPKKRAKTITEPPVLRSDTALDNADRVIQEAEAAIQTSSRNKEKVVRLSGIHNTRSDRENAIRAIRQFYQMFGYGDTRKTVIPVLSPKGQVRITDKTLRYIIAHPDVIDHAFKENSTKRIRTISITSVDNAIIEIVSYEMPSMYIKTIEQVCSLKDDSFLKKVLLEQKDGISVMKNGHLRMRIYPEDGKLNAVVDTKKKFEE